MSTQMDGRVKRERERERARESESESERARGNVCLDSQRPNQFMQQLRITGCVVGSNTYNVCVGSPHPDQCM
jgi:hypothetical protein